MNDGDTTNSIFTSFSTSIPIGIHEVMVYDIYEIMMRVLSIVREL